MRRCDAVIVGGGPAGSSCAWALRRAGRDVVVVDRAAFPRDKICAGWITPAVIASLEIDVADFRRGRTFQPITGFRTGRIRGRHVETRYPEAISFGIRRCEFDHYLLCRSGAEVRPDTPVASLRRESERWIVNDEIEAPVLVGAGGHFCPVARHLGGGGGAEPIVAAQEFEVPLNEDEHDACPVRPEMPELYFARDFKGYGWCFRKQGVVNVGYGRIFRPRGSESRALPLSRGALRAPLNPPGDGLSAHVADFMDFMRERGRLGASVSGRMKGHAYLLYESTPRPPVGDGVLLVGDAAGLAYAPSGEGIRTAVESGLLAAQTIREAKSLGRADLEPYARRIEARFGGKRKKGGPARLLPERVVQALGAGLLASSWLTRKVVLERWFLHAHQPALTAP